MKASGPILECDWIVPYPQFFIWLPISVIWAFLPSLPMASPWILVQRKLGLVGAGLGLMSFSMFSDSFHLGLSFTTYWRPEVKAYGSGGGSQPGQRRY